jgi:hypothetical protein
LFRFFDGDVVLGLVIIQQVVTFLELHLIQGLVEDYSIDPPASRVAIVGHNGLAYQSLLNGSTLFFLRLITVDVVKIVNIAEYSFGAHNFGGSINLKIKSRLKEDKVSGITLEKLEVGATNVCPFRGVEEFACLADLNKVEFSELIPEIVVEEVLNDEFLIISHGAVGKIHCPDQFQF